MGQIGANTLTLWISTALFDGISVPDGYPRISESPTLKAVEKDRSTMLTCSATGSPDPTIAWLKDFIPVDLSDPRISLQSTGKEAPTHPPTPPAIENLPLTNKSLGLILTLTIPSRITISAVGNGSLEMTHDPFDPFDRLTR